MACVLANTKEAFEDLVGVPGHGLIFKDMCDELANQIFMFSLED